MDDRVSELLEQVRRTAASIGQSAGVYAQAAGKKAGQVADVAKLNLKIFDLKTEIDELLRKMGQMMYDTHKGKDVPQQVLTDILAQIDAKHEEIAQERARINTLRNSRPCPQCAASCAPEDKFCRACGADLSQL